MQGKSTQSIPAAYPHPGIAEPDVVLLVCVKKGLIPYLLQTCKSLQRRAAWVDEATYQAATADVLEFKEALMSGACVADLTAAIETQNDLLKRLIVLVGGTGALPDPAVPPVPFTVSDDMLTALRGDAVADTDKNLLTKLTSMEAYLG